jgi:hypothetical protein
MDSESAPWRLRRGYGMNNPMLRQFACALFVVAAVGAALPARAQGKVVTISEVTIVGRIQKPIAAVDVSRIQPKMTLAELRQPFLDRIEKAVYLAPF